MKQRLHRKLLKTVHLRSKIFINIIALFCVILIYTVSAVSQTIEPKLAELRRLYAVNYLQSEAHFALAQYYLEKDNPVQAFCIMEYARRYRFEEKEFDAAFMKYFGDNRAEPDAKAKTEFENAYKLLEQKKTDEAEQSFITAAKLAPKSFAIQTWVGRFYYKVKLNNAEALKYYYKAYFLYPHAYETEFVESRIRNITTGDAEKGFAEMIKNGRSLPQITTDPNPLIVGEAIEQMAKQWKKEYAESLLKAMENDDDLVRWFAFQALFQNAGTSADQLIATMMKDADLRKRGLAAYAMIEFQKEKSFDALKTMLGDNAELIRFDAASALALKGGTKGLEILREHRKTETNHALKSLIDTALKPE